MSISDSPIISGFCQCGCGQKTEVAPRTRSDRGWTKGQPKPFVSRHNRKCHAVQLFVRDSSKLALLRRDYDIDPETGCWLWRGSRDGKGYARVHIGNGHYAVHRVIYERLVGPIGEERQLDHLCRVRHCINPEHLEPVLCVENIRRGNLPVLNVESAQDIRARLASGESQASLATAYGVTQPTIHAVMHGITWKDIPC